MEKKRYRLSELAQLLDVTLKGNPNLIVEGVGPLETAGPTQITFLANPKYKAKLERCRAAAVIGDASLEDVGLPVLVSSNPYWTMAKAAQLFYSPPVLNPGIHASALISPEAFVAEDASVGPWVHVGPGASIGSGTRLYGHVYVGAGVTIGAQCLIYPHVTILDGCRLGNRVIIHSGTVIGSDGFGFAQDAEGRSTKIPQTGIVQIDDDVEIGANCTVDRATFGRTWIQEGVKIDNLVHIAHNVTIGRHSLLVAQVGIAGSVTLGNHVVLGGQVGIAGHVTVGDRVRIGAKSAISHSVEPGQDLLGIPAMPQKQWLRHYAAWLRLPRWQQELAALRDRVRSLEEALGRTSKPCKDAGHGNEC
ncbi:UDP-3-O-(3-hydroxymyristoyl)glucosamine N-acyltransferase [Desulfosoma caldarium]|uniref:UDP-3-O-acylglucosamine N-acyltransferase n=1 Tax=Desulfosoma caldarium TaxID=610254 RepID=A0A3N1UWD2_9BACT|nr:UDP-3-O-(3-hydroxymyristoyl)glucosamine N-acyltransferase [Desulfosoma caldarium]ROQ92231.1 UDP-3-O-[3-hydroxymyristoyl] glucosamine N-acyltransferase [Desulfosoma caldarium]